MNWILFFTVLALVESDGNPKAIGDRHLSHMAYGQYQIRQPMVDDVNRITGKTFTLTEVVSNETISRWYIKTYIEHYANHYNRPLTFETAYRIHNGGPRGWERSATLPNWRRFQEKQREAGGL